MLNKKHIGRIRYSAVLWLLCMVFLSICPVESHGEEMETGQETVKVEYDNLKELLKAGNISLKEDYEDYGENLAYYQEMWELIKWGQLDLEDKAEEAEETGSEDAALYSSNAASLKGSASRIYSQIKEMTNAKSTKSLEKSADSSTMAAQTLMNSYQQIEQTIEARQKNVEALTAVYDETAVKQTIGSATGADLLSAKDQLDQAINSLGTLQEQASQLKNQLLTMLGITLDSNVIIGSIPVPDLTAIDSIDFSTDKVKAVNNNSNVQSTRHTSAKSTSAVNRRFKEVDEAEGTAEASITAAYKNLLAKRMEYQAALNAYDSALITYQSLQKKKQAGMLSKADYLQGEAEYLESKADKENASMSLVQAYEDYRWEVKGIAES